MHTSFRSLEHLYRILYSWAKIWLENSLFFSLTSNFTKASHSKLSKSHSILFKYNFYSNHFPLSQFSHLPNKTHINKTWDSEKLASFALVFRFWLPLLLQASLCTGKNLMDGRVEEREAGRGSLGKKTKLNLEMK
jgi:hypothetical protein